MQINYRSPAGKITSGRRAAYDLGCMRCLCMVLGVRRPPSTASLLAKIVIYWLGRWQTAWVVRHMYLLVLSLFYDLHTYRITHH